MTVPIVMTAFCRPILTRNSILSILERFPRTILIVSQDGKIPGFYEEDHESTRQVLKLLARQYPQIKINLRDRNSGLTGHLVEVFHQTFKAYSNIIYVEEDMRLDNDGFKFLTEIENDKGFSHRSVYSTTNHPATLNLLDYRLSYFPEQWGIAINYEVFEAFKEENLRKRVERSLVKSIILGLGYSRIRTEFLSDFWTQLLRQEVSAPHGWDATLQLALWRSDSPSRVSLKSFVKDLGGGEGSITKRIAQTEKFKIASGRHNLASFETCLFCEKQDALRRGFSPISQMRSRLRIRTRFSRYLELKKYL